MHLSKLVLQFHLVMSLPLCLVCTISASTGQILILLWTLSFQNCFCTLIQALFLYQYYTAWHVLWYSTNPWSSWFDDFFFIIIIIQSVDQKTQAFKEVVIIRHPRLGEYAIGFITSTLVLQVNIYIDRAWKLLLYMDFFKIAWFIMLSELFCWGRVMLYIHTNKPSLCWRHIPCQL